MRWRAGAGKVSRSRIWCRLAVVCQLPPRLPEAQAVDLVQLSPAAPRVQVGHQLLEGVLALADGHGVHDLVLERVRGERGVMAAHDREAAIAQGPLGVGQHGARLVAVRGHRGGGHDVRPELEEHAVELRVLLEPHVQDADLVLRHHRRQGREGHRLREPEGVLEAEAAGLERGGLHQQDPHRASLEVRRSGSGKRSAESMTDEAVWGGGGSPSARRPGARSGPCCRRSSPGGRPCGRAA